MKMMKVRSKGKQGATLTDMGNFMQTKSLQTPQMAMTQMTAHRALTVRASHESVLETK
jgi:hypothetical protein